MLDSYLVPLKDEFKHGSAGSFPLVMTFVTYIQVYICLTSTNRAFDTANQVLTLVASELMVRVVEGLI